MYKLLKSTRNNRENGLIVDLFINENEGVDFGTDTFNVYRRYSGYINQAITALNVYKFFNSLILGKLLEDRSKVYPVTSKDMLADWICQLEDNFGKFKILNEVFNVAVNDYFGLFFDGRKLVKSEDLIEKLERNQSNLDMVFLDRLKYVKVSSSDYINVGFFNNAEKLIVERIKEIYMQFKHLAGGTCWMGHIVFKGG